MLTLLISNNLSRYEFQDRGAIHAHCLLRLKGGPSEPELKLAFDTFCTDVAPSPPKQGASEDEIAYYKEQLETYQKVQKAQKKIAEFVTQQVGISTVHPNLEPKSWPLPYGQNPVAPVEHVIRQSFDKITETDESLLQGYERVINRGQIHNCLQQYCLKDLGKVPKQDGKNKKQKKMLDQHKDNVKEIDGRLYACRFGYPEEPFGYDYQFVQGEQGDILNAAVRNDHCQDGVAFIPNRTQAEAGLGHSIKRDFKSLRNHPTINNHIKEAAVVWRANTGGLCHY